MDLVDSRPKAVLHDHLDGGLRVSTILDLAADVGHTLPASDEDALADWFHQGQSGSLERYLEAFEHTIAVMQSPEAVERVAREAVIDLADDGVVYGEIRFDPGLFTRSGLSREDVIEAALSGFASGSQGRDISAHAIICGLRHQDDTELAADAAIRFLGDGVVAFDLAGPERGFPPDAHMAAIAKVHRAGLGLTLHAGEGDGAHSMWRALALCGAQRIGHGVHITEDTDFDGAAITKLGSLAQRVLDQRIPLEVAVTSNLHTASHPTAAEHPFGALYAAGLNVTINTDNRLMSDVSVGSEYALVSDVFALDLEALGMLTENAIRAGFGPWNERRRLINDVVRPAYGLPGRI